MLAAVEPERPTFSLAGAGSVLIGSTAACIVAGALIGLAVGKVGYGFAIGAVVGVPVGVAATVIKYRNI
jgi:predicted MFS family arabinose efflux permease